LQAELFDIQLDLGRIARMRGVEHELRPVFGESGGGEKEEGKAKHAC